MTERETPDARAMTPEDYAKLRAAAIAGDETRAKERKRAMQQKMLDNRSKQLDQRKKS